MNSDITIQIKGVPALVRRLQRAGAPDGDISKALTIATSITARQVRRRADRIIAADLGPQVKAVKSFFPAPRKTEGGLISRSHVMFGFAKGIPFDTFKVRKFKNKGVRVTAGRKKYDFPKGFLINRKRDGKQILLERKGGKLERPLTESPATYIDRAGPVLEQYAAQRLRANVTNRLRFMLLKLESNANAQQ